MSKRGISQVDVWDAGSKRPRYNSMSRPTSKVVRPPMFKKARKSSYSTFAKKVRQIISRSAEKKQIDTTITHTTFGSNATASGALVIPLLPNAATMTLAQGTAVNQRLGNRIRVKKVTFRGCIVPAPYSASFNAAPEPQHVKFYFMSYKDTPNIPLNQNATPFYRSSATTSAMGGTGADPYLQIDHESITVYHEAVFTVGFSSYSDAGGIVNMQYYKSNDVPVKQEFSFDVTKWCPKEVVWDDAATTPTSRQLSCVMEATNAISGNVQGATSSLTSAIYGQIHFEFYDV